MAFLVLLGGCMQHRGAARCSITVQSAAHMVYSMVSQWLQGGLGQPIPTPTTHRGGGGIQECRARDSTMSALISPTPTPQGGWGGSISIGGEGGGPQGLELIYIYIYMYICIY